MKEIKDYHHANLTAEIPLTSDLQEMLAAYKVGDVDKLNQMLKETPQTSPKAEEELITLADVPFVQELMAKELEESDHSDHIQLKKIYFNFNGLCEVICNQLIIDDGLGNKHSSYHRDLMGIEQEGGKIKADEKAIEMLRKSPLHHKINVESLEETGASQTHIVEISSIFRLMLAYFFNIYPHNIFSNKEQIQYKDKTVNEDLLKTKLDNMEDSTYLKFMVFKKQFPSFEGHSMLIKKIGIDNYSFFDPDRGEFTNLNIEQLSQKINSAMVKHEGTHMAFLDGDAYIKSLEKANQKTSEPIQESSIPSLKH